MSATNCLIIKFVFGVWTRVGPRNRGGRKGDNFGSICYPIVNYSKYPA